MITIDAAIQQQYPIFAEKIYRQLSLALEIEPTIQFVVITMNGEIGILTLYHPVEPGRWWRKIVPQAWERHPDIGGCDMILEDHFCTLLGERATESMKSGRDELAEAYQVAKDQGSIVESHPTGIMGECGVSPGERFGKSIRS